MVTNYVFLVAFLLIIGILSYISYRRIQEYKDFNLAGRNTGLFRLVATLSAAEFNTATLIGGAGVAYAYGLVGLWYTALIFIPVFLIYALAVAKKYRRLGIKTIAEFFDARFKGRLGEATRGIVTLVTASYTWIAPATYIAGITVIGNILLGINPLLMAFGITIFCIMISIAGGFLTAIWSDVVAYIMILIGVPIIFLLGWNVAGGFEALNQVYEPKFLSLDPVWDIEDYHFGIVITWGITVAASYIGSPWYGQRIFSAKDEQTARLGMLINTFSITGLYALIVFATMFSRVALPSIDNPEEALPSLIATYAPPIIQGILLITLLLVGMSTIVAMMNSAVSITVNDIVQRYLFKNKDEKFYINISRLCFLLVGAVTIVFSLLFIGNILLALIYISAFLVQLSFPILAGFYWKKYNTIAAMSSLISGIVYVTVALLLGFPTEYVTPLGLLFNIIVGTIVAFSTNTKTPQSDVEDFFKKISDKAHGDDKSYSSNENIQ
ncbi:sodium:solute symporter family protein [Salicibibacter cibarius]|uniref:Sodium:solute symporter family protein n=1 Tax=Salicibibacter cibarius TaxID=2743000 RepID=A0A7T6Z4H8_9BACI|nr:sodium:solute symporter family protein [Salicibibacter cibarius]QQK76658.1 sodium:solute symporter family protein [Salicibibacter cibarius]